MQFVDIPTLLYQALYLLAVFCLLPLSVSMLTGLVLSIIQAATQIQEQTLSFVPKLIAVSMTLFFAAPWLGRELSEFFTSLLVSLPLLEQSW